MYHDLDISLILATGPYRLSRPRNTEKPHNIIESVELGSSLSAQAETCAAENIDDVTVESQPNKRVYTGYVRELFRFVPNRLNIRSRSRLTALDMWNCSDERNIQEETQEAEERGSMLSSEGDLGHSHRTRAEFRDIHMANTGSEDDDGISSRSFSPNGDTQNRRDGSAFDGFARIRRQEEDPVEQVPNIEQTLKKANEFSGTGTSMTHTFLFITMAQILRIWSGSRLKDLRFGRKLQIRH